MKLKRRVNVLWANVLKSNFLIFRKYNAEIYGREILNFVSEKNPSKKIFKLYLESLQSFLVNLIHF